MSAKILYDRCNESRIVLEAYVTNLEDFTLLNSM